MRTGKELRSSRMVDELTNRGANHERDGRRDGGGGGRGRSAVARERGWGGGWKETEADRDGSRLDLSANGVTYFFRVRLDAFFSLPSVVVDTRQTSFFAECFFDTR